MVKILSNKFLLLLGRIILAAVFIFAGMEKIINPEGFAVSIDNYKLLPTAAVNIAAITLPWIEVAAGLLLLFGTAVKESALLINGMLVVFIAAIGISIARGLNIDCGCFGTAGGSQVGFLKLLENSSLLFIGIILMFFGSDYLSIEGKKKEN
jgi:putative oxidoreductase